MRKLIMKRSGLNRKEEPAVWLRTKLSELGNENLINPKLIEGEKKP